MSVEEESVSLLSPPMTSAPESESPSVDLLPSAMLELVFVPELSVVELPESVLVFVLVLVSVLVFVSGLVSGTGSGSGST